MTGSQVGQGNMTGTIVVDESFPVVVSQMLVLIGKSVKSSMDTPAGTVVIVDVISSTPFEDVEVGAGPTVRVDPSVVIVVSPVIADDPKGIVKTIVEPSGSVRVSSVAVGRGVIVSVLPSVVMVRTPVVAGSVPPPPDGTETLAQQDTKMVLEGRLALDSLQ